MVDIPKGPADPVRAARFQVLARAFDDATRAQDIPRALDWAKRAMAEGFAHPAFFNLIAYLDIRQGRVAEAIALLHNGLVMAPNDANLLNQLGVAHNHLGQYRDAIRAFDKALAAVPGFAPPLYNRGLAYEALGDAGAPARIICARSNRSPATPKRSRAWLIPMPCAADTKRRWNSRSARLGPMPATSSARSRRRWPRSRWTVPTPPSPGLPPC